MTELVPRVVGTLSTGEAKDLLDVAETDQYTVEAAAAVKRVGAATLDHAGLPYGGDQGLDNSIAVVVDENGDPMRTVWMNPGDEGTYVAQHVDSRSPGELLGQAQAANLARVGTPAADNASVNALAGLRRN
jgi:hypothetical protein